VGTKDREAESKPVQLVEHLGRKGFLRNTVLGGEEAKSRSPEKNKARLLRFTQKGGEERKSETPRAAWTIGVGEISKKER